MHIDNAIRFANLASGVAVGKIGSAAVSLNEILKYETSLKKHNKINQIKTFDQISVIVDDLKNKNKTIVFTNGCFDLLHVGHIKYLEEEVKVEDLETEVKNICFDFIKTLSLEERKNIYTNILEKYELKSFREVNYENEKVNIDKLKLLIEKL